MKVSTILAVSAATVLVANAESYSEPDQAIWIDRHNYFRRTGLPWSAGNMRRIDWDADLATKAASTASKCSATCGKGINAFQTSLTNASSAIDEAIQQWVVETGVTTIKTMAQPGSSGLDVGVGYYNSYSQILWAETTSVGCATATCSGGELVVCEYSPPGNDGKSPWYNHASQGSECPDGTTASGGLCIDEGNDANSPIAPIPDGKYTYQVYPAFVTDIQTILLNTARDIANGSIPPTTQSSNSTSSTPEATTATPSKETTPSSKTKTSSSASSSGSSSSESSTKQETPKKAADTKLSSESSPASQVTQDDGEQAPGTTMHLDDAVHHANQALEIDSNNVKALYRRAQAYRLKDEFDLAHKDIARAIELSKAGETKQSADSLLIQEKKLLQAKVFAYKLRTKQVSAAMFGTGDKTKAPERYVPGLRVSDSNAMALNLKSSSSASTLTNEFPCLDTWQPSTRGLKELQTLVSSLESH
ncbi:hypothetical protein PPTG_24316 [Phytophthora nicotianae INRA-310]|uniref:SCP domain-containing protein n=1 Tax=Phytophthora nicotianae (strain INRA-310) TaxID=761204 RepID=W2PJB7_PHYN3|nr:hypothetical protein PPTG_24316 [Phytophthora nicotianae INRA-310]ETN00120.1 hypothetical protein PPTG_24316 [Phytophthora nicotianae INRA-310]